MNNNEIFCTYNEKWRKIKNNKVFCSLSKNMKMVSIEECKICSSCGYWKGIRNQLFERLKSGEIVNIQIRLKPFKGELHINEYIWYGWEKCEVEFIYKGVIISMSEELTYLPFFVGETEKEYDNRGLDIYEN